MAANHTTACPHAASGQLFSSPHSSFPARSLERARNFGLGLDLSSSSRESWPDCRGNDPRGAARNLSCNPLRRQPRCRRRPSCEGDVGPVPPPYGCPLSSIDQQMTMIGYRSPSMPCLRSPTNHQLPAIFTLYSLLCQKKGMANGLKGRSPLFPSYCKPTAICSSVVIVYHHNS